MGQQKTEELEVLIAVSWQQHCQDTLSLELAATKVQQKIEDLEVLVDHLADTLYNHLTA